MSEIEKLTENVNKMVDSINKITGYKAGQDTPLEFNLRVENDRLKKSAAPFELKTNDIFERGGAQWVFNSDGQWEGVPAKRMSDENKD